MNITLLLQCKQWYCPQEMQIKLVLFFSISAKKTSPECRYLDLYHSFVGLICSID